MNVSLDKIAPPVAFVIVGCVMIVVGAIGVVPIGSPQPPIAQPIFQVVLVILGAILVLLGPYFVWQELHAIKKTSVSTVTQAPSLEEQNKPSSSPGKVYGIRITSPPPGKRFRGGYGNLTVEVSGTYRVKPPLGTTLRLFVKTNEPLSYWRHPPVVRFDENNRTWYGKVDLWKGHNTRAYEAYILAAVLDELDEAVVEYASKVQRETNKNIPFDKLPCHIETSDNEVLSM